MSYCHIVFASGPYNILDIPVEIGRDKYKRFAVNSDLLGIETWDGGGALAMLGRTLEFA